MKEETIVTEQNVDTDQGSMYRQSVKSEQHVSGTVLAVRVVYYIGGAILLLLGVRFILLLLGASQASGFVDAIYSISSVFVAPFNGIFTKPTYGASTFDSATIVAMIVYTIVMVGIAKLITLNSSDRDVV